jgi:hypothetical protein
MLGWAVAVAMSTALVAATPAGLPCKLPRILDLDSLSSATPASHVCWAHTNVIMSHCVAVVDIRLSLLSLSLSLPEHGGVWVSGVRLWCASLIVDW